MAADVETGHAEQGDILSRLTGKQIVDKPPEHGPSILEQASGAIGHAVEETGAAIREYPGEVMAEGALTVGAVGIASEIGLGEAVGTALGGSALFGSLITGGLLALPLAWLIGENVKVSREIKAHGGLEPARVSRGEPVHMGGGGHVPTTGHAHA